MSARDRLFEAMAGGWSLTHAEATVLYQIVDDVLGVHAHGLAERQRGALDGVMDRWLGQFHQDAFEELIAVIDPKAAPVRPDEKPTT